MNKDPTVRRPSDIAFKQKSLSDITEKDEANVPFFTVARYGNPVSPVTYEVSVPEVNTSLSLQHLNYMCDPGIRERLNRDTDYLVELAFGRQKGKWLGKSLDRLKTPDEVDCPAKPPDEPGCSDRLPQGEPCDDDLGKIDLIQDKKGAVSYFINYTKDPGIKRSQSENLLKSRSSRAKNQTEASREMNLDVEKALCKSDCISPPDEFASSEVADTIPSLSSSTPCSEESKIITVKSNLSHRYVKNMLSPPI